MKHRFVHPELIFEIEREAILHTVKTLTYYIGESRKEGENTLSATKMQASDENDDILNGFINTAASNINDVMTAILKETHLSREDYITEKGFPSIRFIWSTQIPSTFDANQNNAILQAISDYIVNLSLSKWLDITNPKEAGGYLEKAASNKSDLLHRINQRVRPVRRRPRAMGF